METVEYTARFISTPINIRVPCYGEALGSAVVDPHGLRISGEGSLARSTTVNNGNRQGTGIDWE